MQGVDTTNTLQEPTQSHAPIDVVEIIVQVMEQRAFRAILEHNAQLGQQRGAVEVHNVGRAEGAHDLHLLLEVIQVALVRLLAQYLDGHFLTLILAEEDCRAVTFTQLRDEQAIGKVEQPMSVDCRQRVQIQTTTAANANR